MITYRFIRKACLCAIVATIAGLLLAGCSKTVPRLQPSGLNSSFDFDSSRPYSEYVSHYRRIVKEARVDLQGENDGQIIAANSPFELRPGPNNDEQLFQNGIILIHGLLDSPYHMKYLAEFFRNRGFLARVILLPGHGTRPGDLVDTTLEEWQRAVNYAIEAMQPQVEQLFIGGYSLGGALAIDYTLQNREKVSGLFLFNPSLKVNSSLAPLAELLNKFKTWLVVKKGRDFARYESFATNSGAQINRLIDQIDEQTDEKGLQLDIPVFMALSHEDFTIDSVYTLEFFRNKITGRQSRLLLYTNQKENINEADQRIRLISSVIPSQNIIGSSHQSLLFPPDDPHYGRNGDYKNCLHYPEDSSDFKKCWSGESDFIGERIWGNPRKGTIQRLTWNPKFDEMLAAMDRFIIDQIR